MTDLTCSAGIPVSVADFAETYKVNSPTESCEEPDVELQSNCGDKVTLYPILIT